MQLKRLLQDLAEAAGLYERLKESRFYDLYWTFVGRRLLHERTAEIGFYNALLAESSGEPLIFDVGANRGTKTSIFLRLGARVVAVEPDPVSLNCLTRRFVRRRLRRLPITIVPKALSDAEGVEAMWIDSPGSAKNTLSSKWVAALRSDEKRFGARLEFGTQALVKTATLDQLIGAYGVPLFIKIDVEGLEPRVLAGLSRPVPYLSFEVNLPEFRPEGEKCVRILGGLDRDGVFNLHNGLSSRICIDSVDVSERFIELLASCPERSIEVFWKSLRPPFIESESRGA